MKRVLTRVSVLISVAALVFGFSLSGAFAQKDTYTFVVLSDLHLPVKATEIHDSKMQKKIIAAKNAIVPVINSWNNVDRIVVTGDLVGDNGVDREYEYAKNYLEKFTAPKSVITGNHDYIYDDKLGADGKLKRGTAESRKEKLEKARSYFGIPGFLYSEKENGCLLVFLSTDALEWKYSVELSKENLEAFSRLLSENKSVPTIVFYHAPLAGTVLDKEGKPGSGNFVAQPAAPLDAVLKANPQVFMWISGHTHTSPKKKSFMADFNLYDGRVMDIHNTDLDRDHIWTNVFTIYGDRVEVRTYDHLAGKYLTEFDRAVKIPALDAVK